MNGTSINSKCGLYLDDVIRVVECEILVTATATVDPAWLAWDNGAVVKLAHEIRMNHDFARLPHLRDTLKNAGCSDQDILNHCLEEHRHPPICCVLELLLQNQSHKFERR